MTALAWLFIAGFGLVAVSAALAAATKRAEAQRTYFANVTDSDWEEGA